MERITNPQARAVLSEGRSEERIYRLVARVLRELGDPPGTLLDVGCGTGALAGALRGLYRRYVGCDLVRYDGFPAEPTAEFVEVNLDKLPYALADGMADVVAAVETIEHLENPRAFFRELVRVTRPGGRILVTTPNQLSALSVGTLLLKREFNAFQSSAGLYPAHITALLESDLRKMASESRLEDVRVLYSDSGRIPFTPFHWPARLGMRGRWFSDNVLLCATRPR